MSDVRVGARARVVALALGLAAGAVPLGGGASLAAAKGKGKAMAKAKAPAPARPSVTVFKFVGPGADPVRADVVKALEGSGKVVVKSRDAFLAAVKRAKIPAAALVKPEGIGKAARAAKIDAVIRGFIKKSAGKPVVALQVFGKDGESLWFGELPLTAGRLGKSADRVVSELVPALGVGAASDEDVAAAPAKPKEDELPSLPTLAGGEHLEDEATRDSGEPGEPWGPIKAVRASASFAELFRFHRGRTPEFTSTREDCRGFLCFDILAFPGVTAEIDFHPGALVSRGKGALAVGGLSVRYTFGIPPGTYDFLDPATGEFAPGAMTVGYQHLAANVHATIVLPGPHGPLLEPSVGGGYLDLRVGPNPIGLETMRRTYASLGLRASIPVVADMIHLDLGAEGRLAFGAGAAASAAHGPTGVGRGLGFGGGLDVAWTPLSWLRISGGYGLQYLATRFGGGGSSGWSAPTLADTIHDLHVGFGIQVP